jgi:hypothetical protein
MRRTSEGSVSIEASSDGEKLHIVLWRPADATTEGRGLTLFTLPTSEVLSRPPQEAAALVGARVIAALGQIAGEGFVRLGYTALADQRRELISRQHSEALSSNDSEAIFGVGMDKILESMTTLDAELLDEAERYITKAAQMGDIRAKEFLEVIWPYEKSERLEAIRKANQGSNGST